MKGERIEVKHSKYVMSMNNVINTFNLFRSLDTLSHVNHLLLERRLKHATACTKMIFTLSHGQADLERGFSLNPYPPVKLPDRL